MGIAIPATKSAPLKAVHATDLIGIAAHVPTAQLIQTSELVNKFCNIAVALF